MKKVIFIIILFITLFLVSCKTDNEEIIDEEGHNNPGDIDLEDDNIMKINVLVNGRMLEATLEDNIAAEEFYNMIGDGLTLELEEYGGFEKVGSLGKSLTASDSRIKTSPGDLILYRSSEFSVMYGTNTWSYTRLGHIDKTKSELLEILGSEDVVVQITK